MTKVQEPNRLYLRLISILVIISLVFTGLLTIESRPVQAKTQNALILINQDNYAACQQIIIENNGTIYHAFPPRAMIIAADDTIISKCNDLSQLITTSAIPEAQIPALDEAVQPAVIAWNNMLLTQAAEQSAGSLSAQAVEVSPPNDSFYPPDSGEMSALALDPSLFQQSDYFIGKVAVNIVLLESNGQVDNNSEDWSSAEKQKVVQEITGAMEWWRQMDSRANLQFIYNDYYSSPIPTAYEPITRSYTDERLWISEAMNRLGFNASSYITSVRYFNRDAKQRTGADWAFTIFVVDSSNDPDHKFADNLFAYAYIFGPFMVMTYGNNGYGPDNMDAVAAHEVGHIFGALDEYASAQIPPTSKAGYLSVENGNTAYGGYTNVDCIMRGGITPFTQRAVCPYTRGQIGWRDSDGDGIFDPIDNSINVTASVSLNSSNAILSGNSVINPYPSTSRNPLSINKFSKLQYRINSGIWHNLTPLDGAIDNNQESFSMDIGVAPRGQWEIEVFAQDNIGNYGLSSKQILNVTQGAAAAETSVQISSLNLLPVGQAVITGNASLPPGNGTLSAIEVSVDGGYWRSISAADGAYDSGSENFCHTISGLRTGNHTLNLRALAQNPWITASLTAEQVNVIDGATPDNASGTVFLPVVLRLP